MAFGGVLVDRSRATAEAKGAPDSSEPTSMLECSGQDPQSADIANGSDRSHSFSDGFCLRGGDEQAVRLFPRFPGQPSR